MSQSIFGGLPTYTGNTTGLYFIMNNTDETVTYKIPKETFQLGLATTGSNTFYGAQVLSGSIEITGTTTLGGSIIPKTPRGATLGTLEQPFAEIYVSSGSINIASDIIGDPNTNISNVDGNLLVSAGGMQLVGSGAFNAATGSFQFISGSMEQVGDYTQTGDYKLFGDKVITGSLTVSGSQTLIGTQILRGDKIVTGSISISGSQNFIGSQILIGDKTITGSLYIQSGSGFEQDTGTSLVTYNQTTGKLAHANFSSVISSLFNYGQFSDTTTQSGSANTAHSMRFNSTDLSNNISMVSGSRITFGNSGLYNLQFSAQFTNTGNTNQNIDVWFALTGSNIANSNTRLAINKAQSGNLGEMVAAWNILLPISASNYAEIKWSSDGNNIQLLSEPSGSAPIRPGIPSVIATITQVA